MLPEKKVASGPAPAQPYTHPSGPADGGEGWREEPPRASRRAEAGLWGTLQEGRDQSCIQVKFGVLYWVWGQPGAGPLMGP